MAKFCDYWPWEAEKEFIDRIGTWQELGREIDDTFRAYKRWLQLYITAHIKSPWPHHKQGVEYARGKLAALG